MSNHDRFCGDAVTIEPAVTTGRLYHLPYGFPAMFDASDGRVIGEVMSFQDIEDTLRRLERLEGYRPEGECHYLRIQKSATLLSENIKIPVWVYVYPHSRLSEIPSDLKPIVNGCWRTYTDMLAKSSAR